MLWAGASGEGGGAEGDLSLQAPSLVEEALPGWTLLHAPLLTVRVWLTLCTSQAFPSLELEPPLSVRVHRMVFWICLPECCWTNIFLGLPLYLSPMLKEGKRFLAK